jgi:hypothetical protein
MARQCAGGDLTARRPAAPIAESALEIERYRNCAGNLDWGNAYDGLKPLLDCLVVGARNLVAWADSGQ